MADRRGKNRGSHLSNHSCALLVRGRAIPRLNDAFQCPGDVYGPPAVAGKKVEAKETVPRCCYPDEFSADGQGAGGFKQQYFFVRRPGLKELLAERI